MLNTKTRNALNEMINEIRAEGTLTGACLADMEEFLLYLAECKPAEFWARYNRR